MAKYLCIWIRAYWFSVTLFSKWLPGGHIRFFGFWMAWFRQCNSSLLWNFSFKFHVHVHSGCRQKPNDCRYVAFKMAALWFWTMFNCNPPIAHCHPLLWGGGILVDHWSTISSLFNSSPPGQNGRHFRDDIFYCNFMNGKFCTLIHISQKFVPKSPVGNMSALVQVMAWHRTGDKPLPEPRLT